MKLSTLNLLIDKVNKMERLTVDDPRVMKIGEEWLDFLEDNYDKLPDNATAISLGQVFMFLLQEYKPPMDELIPVMQIVMTVYNISQEAGNKGYVN